MESEFDALVKENDKKINRIIFEHGKGLDFDDVRQEALIKAWRFFANYDRSRPFIGWMGRIIHNTTMDMRRFRDRRIQSVSEIEGCQVGRCSGGIPEVEARIVLDQAASSARAQDVLRIIRLQDAGASIEELAQMHGVPLGSMRSRLWRGRKRISQEVGLI